MLLGALGCLRRELFTYLTFETFLSRFYAFCSALFGSSFSYAN